jgi:uncharacterized glyoxalase superfamily protein PhnB
MIRLSSAVPTFVVSDIGVTAEWYAKELGFKAAFYELVKDKAFVQMPLTKQPYGDTEFEVRDPNGYVLVFGELIGADAALPG